MCHVDEEWACYPCVWRTKEVHSLLYQMDFGKSILSLYLVLKQGFPFLSCCLLQTSFPKILSLPLVIIGMLGFKMQAIASGFLMWVWGIKLKLSTLCGKCFYLLSHLTDPIYFSFLMNWFKNSFCLLQFWLLVTHYHIEYELTCTKPLGFFFEMAVHV